MNLALQDAVQAIARYGHRLRNPLIQSSDRQNQNPPPFRLMDLPRELRDMIYKEMAHNTNVSSPEQRLDYDFLRARIPILQSSKLLAEDCTPILLRYATIEVRVRHDADISPAPSTIFGQISFALGLSVTCGGLSVTCGDDNTPLTIQYYSILSPFRHWNDRPRESRAWYKALARNENLTMVFESRCAPSLESLHSWVLLTSTSSSEPMPTFSYVVRIPEREKRVCVGHRIVIDWTNKRMFGEIILRVSSRGGSVDEIRKIREAYRRAGCDVGYEDMST